MLPPLTDLIALLEAHPQIRTIQIREYEVLEGQAWLVKLRCSLPKGYQLQIRLRLRDEGVEYSYQLFKDRPILRWDNAPHHPDLANFPHHFHDEADVKHPSALVGDPLEDLPAVLKEILEYVTTSG
ncbi:MAG: hypothetical protein D6759_10125 [Chloroflexi bacterium]|nr:MAG: hypothetical protein D6759_10125 [Chloroflexota bacterium]